MNDLSLVDRLRYSGLGASWGALCKEAADALESQAAEIADLKRIRVAVIAERDALLGRAERSSMNNIGGMALELARAVRAQYIPQEPSRPGETP